MSTLPPSAVFNVVVLYERMDLLHKAMATYSHLRREMGNEFTPDLHLWRIDIAASAEFAADCDRDIAAADVIVIGVCGSQVCPPAFRRWRDPAPMGSRGPRSAIIALVDAADSSDAAPETWNGVLRQGAKQIHPEIFVWEPVEERDEVGPEAPVETAAPECVSESALAPV